MNKSINRREFLFALVASLCFIVLALLAFFEDIWFAKSALLGRVEFMDVVGWLVFAALAVVLFLENKNAFLIAAAVYALLYLVNMCRMFDTQLLLSFLACLALAAVAFLSCMGHPIVSKLWFVPAALMFAGALIVWISYKYFSSFALYWKTILANLLEIVAVLFAGRWLKETA